MFTITSRLSSLRNCHRLWHLTRAIWRKEDTENIWLSWFTRFNRSGSWLVLIIPKGQKWKCDYGLENQTIQILQIILQVTSQLRRALQSKNCLLSSSHFHNSVLRIGAMTSCTYRAISDTAPQDANYLFDPSSTYYGSQPTSPPPPLFSCLVLHNITKSVSLLQGHLEPSCADITPLLN